MEIIVIDRKAYSVTKKVLKELQHRQERIDSGEKYHDQAMARLDLEFYIEQGVKEWKCLGYIQFDYRM